jgi:hypothetical protein
VHLRKAKTPQSPRFSASGSWFFVYTYSLFCIAPKWCADAPFQTPVPVKNVPLRAVAFTHKSQAIVLTLTLAIWFYVLLKRIIFFKTIRLGICAISVG